MYVVSLSGATGNAERPAGDGRQCGETQPLVHAPLPPERRPNLESVERYAVREYRSMDLVAASARNPGRTRSATNPAAAVATPSTRK